jgi:hypothetical protein
MLFARVQREVDMVDPKVIEMIRPLVKQMTADERLELIRAIIAAEPDSASRSLSLAERGITPYQAADLRARLRTFEDWDDPAMEAYDAL